MAASSLPKKRRVKLRIVSYLKLDNAYLAGKLAYWQGKPRECPPEITHELERRMWFNGWIEAEMQFRLNRWTSGGEELQGS
jgi:ribosome modulation factor